MARYASMYPHESAAAAVDALGLPLGDYCADCSGFREWRVRAEPMSGLLHVPHPHPGARRGKPVC